MLNAKSPPENQSCDTSAIAKNQAFGRKLNITGTPTMFFANGERVPGYMSADKVEENLNKLNKKTPRVMQKGDLGRLFFWLLKK